VVLGYICNNNPNACEIAKIASLVSFCISLFSKSGFRAVLPAYCLSSCRHVCVRPFMNPLPCELNHLLYISGCVLVNGTIVESMLLHV